MKIISDLNDDVWHKLGNSSYEWWYFDAITDNGYSFVVTFFYGLPFSPYYNEKIVQLEQGKDLADPSNHVAFYFCLYENARPIAYILSEYTRKDFFASESKVDVKVGNNLLTYDQEQGFLIKINDLALWGRKVEGEIAFKPEFFPSINWPLKSSQHVWNCVSPRCQVHGELTITGLIKKRKIALQAIGYHDHNYGIRPMHNDMKRWHWGRIHTKKQTAIYYIIENNNEPEAFLMVLSSNGEIVYCDQAIYQFKPKKDLMGVEYFSQIKLNSKETNLIINIEKTYKVDQGPFYLRFLASQKLELETETVENIGFAEAFEPAKLFVKAYWPFIKMPIRKYS